jgi:hypothetical protein
MPTSSPSGSGVGAPGDMPFADGVDARLTLLDVKDSRLGRRRAQLPARLELEHSRPRRPERLDPVLAGMQDQPPRCRDAW